MNRRALVVLLAAGAVGLVLLRRQPPRDLNVAAPACGDGAACDERTPPPVAPIVSATASASRRMETRAVEPSASPVPADDTRREDVDRLLAAGKVQDAIDAFRKLVVTEPTAKNHGDLGTLLYTLTAFDEAAVHLRAAAELEPGNADRWIALANVYYRKVNPGEAWKAEKRAREAEPGLELGRDGTGMRVRQGAAPPP